MCPNPMGVMGSVLVLWVYVVIYYTLLRLTKTNDLNKLTCLFPHSMFIQ